MDEGQLGKSEPYLKLMERNGIEITRHSSEELTRRLPGLVTSFESDENAELMGLPPINGGVFGHKCGRLDPDKLVRYYANEFIKMGGELAFSTEARALLLGPSKRLGIEGEPFVWQETRIEGVSTDRMGAVNADNIVLAGGAWENELLEPVGIESHVKAKKRQLFSVPARGGGLQALMHARGFNKLGLLPLVILPKSGVHFKPVSEEGDFWIACEDQVNRPFIDLPEHDLEKYQAEREFYEKSVYPVLTSYFPDFRDARIKAMWGGLYAYNTIDSIPFAFRSGNLIVVGGDSGSGIMKGDSLGRIVDALYRDQPEATLFGDIHYATSKIGFERRDVEKEEWVI